MDKVIITGATGAIGRALIKVCTEAGYGVLAVVHRKSPRADELARLDRCKVLRLDTEEYTAGLDEIRRQEIPDNGYRMFFHLAWAASFGSGREDFSLQLGNVEAALAAVQLAKDLGCDTFIGAGSQAEYGRTEGILSETTPTHPETGYGITKLCAGQLTRLACEKQGMRHIWTRILSVYGPFDREETLISTAVSSMLAKEDTAFTPCEQLWDYIYSEDAARAMLLAGEKGESGRVYVIGSGEARKLRTYVETIARITGYTGEIGFGRRPYNDKQVMYLQADINALQELGFQPEVSFEQGIERIVRWRLSRKNSHNEEKKSG